MFALLVFESTDKGMKTVSLDSVSTKRGRPCAGVPAKRHSDTPVQVYLPRETEYTPVHVYLPRETEYTPVQVYLPRETEFTPVQVYLLRERQSTPLCGYIY